MAKNIHAPAATRGPALPGHAERVETRLIAYAEQLGWVVGTVQAKSEGWLDRETWTDQLTRIRDGAADLLTHFTQPQSAGTSQDVGATVGSRAPQSNEAYARRRGRSGGVVDAPGKRHRTPPPSAHGVKHSDERIPKLKAATLRGRRSGRG